MQQKNKIENELETNFLDIQKDLKSIQCKRFTSKRTVYKPGDLISNIFYIVSGDFILVFQDKVIHIPPGNIVGDYEPSQHLTRRTTTLRSGAHSLIVILPFDYYFNVREQIINRDRFLSSSFPFSDRRIKYLLTKLFKEKHVKRLEQVKLEQKCDSVNMAIIRSGIFIVKKSVRTGVFVKYQTEVTKEFGLIEVGSGQILVQNFHCQSPKGIVYVCGSKQLTDLSKNFQEFSTYMASTRIRVQEHQKRKESIRLSCRSRSKLLRSILPPALTEEQQERLKSESEGGSKEKKSLLSGRNIKKLISQKNKKLSKHYFEVTRQKNDILCQQTNSNLELIPLVKARRPTMPSPLKLNRKDRVSRILNRVKTEEKTAELSRSERSYSDEKYLGGQSIQIPDIFDSKFKRKMFEKAANPFHHFRSQSERQPEQQQVRSFSPYKKLDLAELNPGSYLLQIK